MSDDIEITRDLLELYGFKLVEQPISAQGGDSYFRDGFIITKVHGNEYVHGSGAAKESVSTIDELKTIWLKHNDEELNIVR